MTHTLLVGADVVFLILFAVYSIGAAPIFAVLKVPAEILPACEKLMFLYALSQESPISTATMSPAR